MSRQRKSRTDILQGMLDMLILRVVREEPLHGYAIGKRLAEVSENRLQIPQGSLYPALHRLENRGLLASEWSVAGGRKVKTYSLTAGGRRQLRDEVAGWEELSVAISLVLGTS